MRVFIILFIVFHHFSFAQKADSTRAFHIALGTEIVLYTTTMYALNDLWYKDYPKSELSLIQ